MEGEILFHEMPHYDFKFLALSFLVIVAVAAIMRGLAALF